MPTPAGRERLPEDVTRILRAACRGDDTGWVSLSLRSETFARAIELFGARGVVDLAALMGNYASTAVILNAVDQQLRPEQPPLLPP